VTRRRRQLSVFFFATTILLSCQASSLDPQEITAAETLWKTNGLTSYRIELRVERELERRVEVTVRDGAIEEGVLLERADGEGWEPPTPLDETQARPYTVPGLFQTLREELSTGQRTVSARFNQNRGYVEHMELGPIARSPAALITVVSLEPL